MDAAGARLVGAARLRWLCARARFHRARLDRSRRRTDALHVTWALAARDLRDAGDVWAASERTRPEPNPSPGRPTQGWRWVDWLDRVGQR